MTNCIENLEKAGKIGENQYNLCMLCVKAIPKDGLNYCTDKKCLSHRKRLHTKKVKIIEKDKWSLIEGKIMKREKKENFENSIYPYLILESIIDIAKSKDIENILCRYLKTDRKGLYRKGKKLVYELKPSVATKLIQLITLRHLGLERATKIVGK